MRLTGKPDSEISRILSLLKLDSDVPKQARAEATGEITRRHLIAVATLNPAAQQQTEALKKKNAAQDRAYKSALDKIPDQKPVDPWAKVR